MPAASTTVFASTEALRVVGSFVGAKWTRQWPATFSTRLTRQLGEDLGAMRLGVGKIGQRDGVLGADIAARAAIAAERAGRLLDARRIDGRLEADDDGRRRPVPRRRQALAASSARNLVSSDGMRIARRAQHGLRPGQSPDRASPSPRTSSGQAGSAKTRASGRKPTAALISEPPPSPQPISTWMSLPRRKSNRPVRRPLRILPPFTCSSRRSSGRRLGTRRSGTRGRAR